MLGKNDWSSAAGSGGLEDARGHWLDSAAQRDCAALGVAGEPEPRHDAVADELVDHPARLLDRLGRAAAIAVEDGQHN